MISLKVLYEQMYEHTKGECANCKVPHSCCSPEYCMMAEMQAQEDGVSLDEYRTNHDTLTFMGEGGCTLPPHFRPVCTVHTCEINGLGVKIDDPGWTDKYFELREQIDLKEWERIENK